MCRQSAYVVNDSSARSRMRNRPMPTAFTRGVSPARQTVRRRTEALLGIEDKGWLWMGAYDSRNCQSLFGYAADVHERSGGICQLCGCGASELDFDLWRQLTVEHLIGASQGGYKKQIQDALMVRFPGLSPNRVTELARRIDEVNTVTACSFCNSTTSRTRSRISMSEAIEMAPDGTDEEVFRAVTSGLRQVLEDKRREVSWKLDSVRRAFDDSVEPRLRRAREKCQTRARPT